MFENSSASTQKKYFILSMLTIEYASQRSRTERDNLLLTTVSIQAKKEIAQLSDSKKQAAIYRHDLKHHMNFIQNCIQEQKTEEALSYINEICTTLQSGAIQKYCENDIPVSHKVGHGFGVQSMISVVNKYSGIYGFFAQNGEFRFQATF